MIRKRLIFLSACCIAASAAVCAGTYEQDFEGWTANIVGLAPAQNYTHTDGWSMSQGQVRTSLGWTAPHGGSYAGWLEDADVSSVSWFQSPLLTNGIGTVSLWLCNKVNGWNAFDLLYSTNGTQWTRLVTITNQANANIWQQKLIPLKVYQPAYLRIHKVADSTSSQYLGIDDISISAPPATVSFVGTTTDPELPLVGRAIDIATDAISEGGVSNLSVSLYWQAAVTTGTWNATVMTNTAGTAWRSVAPIDPQNVVGTKVYYYLHATFDGFQAASPTNDPASGVFFYEVQARDFETGQEALWTTDYYATNMVIVSDYLWQGVFDAGAGLAGGAFRFQGQSTNLVTTNTWGDSNQADFDLPMVGAAEADAAAITIAGTNAGGIMFRFNETSGAYTVRSCTFQDFEGWLTANYETSSNNGWAASHAYIATDNQRKLRGNACFLESNGLSWVRSPYLPDGVGTISFWLRNWETNGTPSTEVYIQVSRTGGSSPSEWETIATILDVTADKYGRYVTATINDRYLRYVRIANSASLPSARLCIDEILVEHPGAGIVYGNVAIAPPAPTVADPVHVHADIAARAGATNRVATLYWRSGSTGAFTPIGLSTSDGVAYSTTTAIPAASGDGDGGAGDVQYFIACSFDGLEAEYASPTLYPEDGSNYPASFTIAPAMVAVSNVVHSPSPAVVNQDVSVSADIVPYNGAYNVAARVYYRLGSDGWSSTPMTQSGPQYRYVTDPAIPGSDTPGERLQYYVRVTFSGASAASPTNYPTGGSTAPISLLFRQGAYESAYTNVSVTGPFGSELTLVGDGAWMGVAQISTNIVDASFFFNALNGGSTSWGDSDQAFTEFPVFGTAEQGGGAILLSGTNTGYFVFQFNETNGEYSVQQCSYVDFDAWSGATSFGTYSNADNWLVADARIGAGDDAARVMEGQSCVLDNGAGAQYVLSPYLADGVGEVGFWYRNWETNGVSPGELYVEVGETPSGPWQNVATVSDILTLDYLYCSVLLSDRYHNYVRIAQSTNSPNYRLCLDEIFVAQPGPGVIFSNVVHTPESPAVVDEVTVSVDIIPTGNATNISAVVWYRAGTNGSYEATPLVNVGGNTFQTQPPIPRGPLGIMQYYIDCWFTGMRQDVLVNVQYPFDWYSAPFAYTNGMSAVRVEDFEDWSANLVGIAPWQNYANADGWRMVNGQIRTSLGWTAPHAGQYACWLHDADESTNTWMGTPLLTNRIGAISFWAANYSDGLNVFELQASPDNSTWTTLTAFTNGGPMRTWHLHTYEINTNASLYLRLKKTYDQGNSQYLGIDDVVVSYGAAAVAFSNVMIHPGYPTDRDTVDVSCEIYSIDEFFPAMDIRARLYYRRQGDASYSGPVEMNRSGSRYVTSSPIPLYDARDVVQYYIESTFKGYSHIARESRSPSFYPAGTPNVSTTQYYQAPTASPASYQVRPFYSQYETIQVSLTNGESVAMSQINDWEWQGIVTFTNGTTDAAFFFNGIAPYTGTNYWWSQNDAWGDSNQEQSVLPYSSTMQPNGASVVLWGTLSGQFLFRFNESNLTYSVLQCAFQDFDTWPASSVYFQESVSKDTIQTVSQNFDSWPMSVTEQRYTEWETWTNVYTTYVIGKDDSGQDGWNTFDSMIIDQVTNTNAVRFNPTVQLGAIRPVQYNLTEGVGTAGFQYRASTTNQGPALYWPAQNWTNVMLEADVRISKLPGDPDKDPMGHCAIRMFARYHDPDNYYELRIETREGYTEHCGVQLYRCQNGVITELVNDPSWRSYNIQSSAKVKFIVSNYDNGKVRLEAYHVNGGDAFLRHDDDPGAGSTLSSPGAVGFSTTDGDVVIDNVRAGRAEAQAFSSWTAGFNDISTKIGWRSTYGQINNNYCEMETNRPALTIPNIRSPRLLHGMRRLRFYYYKRPGPEARCRIQWSTTGGQNPAEWTDLASFYEDGSGWHWYQLDVNKAQAGYVRICNANNASGTGARFIVDYFTVEPSDSLAYYENFNDGAAQNWTDPEGVWSVAGSAYYRPGYIADPLGFTFQYALWEDRNNLDSESVWHTLTNRTGISDIVYNNFTHTLQAADKRFVRVRHTSGHGSLVIDNAWFNSWRGDTRLVNGWNATEAWITSGRSGRGCELRRSRAVPGVLQGVRSPLMSNGVGTVSFWYRSANGVPCSFEVQRTAPLDTNIWDTLTTVQTSSTSWQHLEWSVDLPGQLYVRVVHTSTNPDARLLLDDFSLQDYIERDEFTWVAYNALITGNQTSRLRDTDTNVKGAYLNHGPGIYGDTPELLDDDMPYIQSSQLSSGIGEISFWYRAWDPGTPATIYLKAAPTENTPASNWVFLAGMTNVTADTFQYYRGYFYSSSNKYLRLYCDTTQPAGRFCVDDLLITAPFGVDVSMKNLRTVPTVPLDTDSVRLQVDLYDFFLQPENLEVNAYYHFGTNQWGTWNPLNKLEMQPVATNDNQITFRTVGSIPPRPVDEVVQYYVEAEFDGLFSQYASPKRYQSFTNPEWYYPVDLNEATRSEPIPYYFVFNCHPGQVWINEVNLTEGLLSGVTPTQYVEVCGLADVDVGNWSVEVFDTSVVSKGLYEIQKPEVLANQHEGYGFWVLGESTMAAADMHLTAPMPIEGGLVLRRSMGAIEQAICYGAGVSAPAMTNHPVYPFQYIGADDDFFYASPLALEGEGSNMTSFAWYNDSLSFTPFAVNADQTLVLVTNQPPPVVFITGIEIGESTVWLTCEATPGWDTNWEPLPLRSTALGQNSTAWGSVMPYNLAQSNQVYTIWFSRGTNSRAFYRVMATQNSP